MIARSIFTSIALQIQSTMKPISLRPIFTTSKQKFISNSIFLAFSTQDHQGSYNHNPRRNDEKSRRAAVPVSVWWHLDSCSIPVNTSAFRVAPAIVNAVRALGIWGPIRIKAVGHLEQISMTQQKALSYTGVEFSCDIWKLECRVSFDPPPPEHILFISGSSLFVGISYQLRNIGYNILLAVPDPKSADSSMFPPSTVAWKWNSLLKGDLLSAEFHNQPPVPAWYGNRKDFQEALNKAFPVEEAKLIEKVPDYQLLNEEDISDSDDLPN